MSAASAAWAGPTSWTVTRIDPAPYANAAQSFVTRAVGITDAGEVVGDSLWLFDGERFGEIVVWGPGTYTAPHVLGVTNDGWVYGDLTTIAVIPWGGYTSDAQWLGSTGPTWPLDCCFQIWAQGPAGELTNTNAGAAKASPELLALAAQMNVLLVGVNDRGQAVANTISGQQVAYYFDPVLQSVPEPGTVPLVLAALGVLAVSQRRRPQ
jgi:hypothetical protein